MDVVIETGWKIGDRVRSVPANAHLYEGTPWAEKLARPRGGTVIEVPWHAQRLREGTIRVEWDALVGVKADPEAWRMWTHSNLIEREDAA